MTTTENKSVHFPVFQTPLKFLNLPDLNSLSDASVLPVHLSKVFSDCPVPEEDRRPDPDTQHHLGHQGSVVGLGDEVLGIGIRRFVVTDDRIKRPESNKMNKHLLSDDYLFSGKRTLPISSLWWDCRKFNNYVVT